MACNLWWPVTISFQLNPNRIWLVSLYAKIIAILGGYGLTKQLWLSWNSLCKSGYLWTHTDPPPSQLCRLKVCTTTPSFIFLFSSLVVFLPWEKFQLLEGSFLFIFKPIIQRITLINITNTIYHYLIYNKYINMCIMYNMYYSNFFLLLYKNIRFFSFEYV